MYLTTSAALVLSLGAYLASANPVERHRVGTASATTKCFTRYSIHSTSTVRTEYLTSYKDCTSTAYTTTTTTVTPTSTFTSMTTTTTTETATATVPTPNGFIPIQSSLPGSSYSGSGGTDPLSQRDLGKRSQAHHNVSLIALSAATYEVAVHCYVHEPECASTTTVTETATVPAVTGGPTVTGTDTATMTAYAATLYEACASNNLADLTASGNLLGGDIELSGFTYAFSIDSAYDCCVLAINSSPGNADGFTYYGGLSGACEWRFSSTCTTQSGCQGSISGNSGEDPFYTFGNGLYGEWNSYIVKNEVF